MKISKQFVVTFVLTILVLIGGLNTLPAPEAQADPPVEQSPDPIQRRQWPTPPPPPQPIDPGTEPPEVSSSRLNTPYFYYFGSRPIPLTPITDEIAIGFVPGISKSRQMNVLTLQATADLFLEQEDLPDVQSTMLKLPFGLAIQHIEETIHQLSLQPEVRFVSPVFELENGTKLFATDEVIANFKPDLSNEQIEQVLGQMELRKVENLHFDGETWIVKVQANFTSALSAANTLFESGIVNYAEPNFVVMRKLPDVAPPTRSRDQTDASSLAAASSQWNLDKIGAQNAWSLLGTPEHRVVVAVIDDGVQDTHEDLTNNVDPFGYNAILDQSGIGKGRPTYYKQSHGTLVAGVIAAERGNGLGYDGVAGDFAKVMPVRKVSYKDDKWYSTTEWTFRSIKWAYENGADVINCSWGSDPMSIIFAIINHAYEIGRSGKGTIIVAATGNDGDQKVSFPASHPQTIAVGATTQQDQRVLAVVRGWGSNYGRELDLVAPGVDSWSADLMGEDGIPGNYALFGGTSSATPHVVGVVALMLAANPNLTAAQVQDILQRTAEEVGSYSYTDRALEGGWSYFMGFGRLDAYEAVRAVKHPPQVQILAQGVNDQAQLVATWRYDYRHVVYHEDDITISNGTSSYIPLNGVGPGCYDFYLKTDHALRRKWAQCVEVGQQYSLDFTHNGTSLLFRGDANGDNEINISDFAIWKVEFLQHCTGLCRSDFDGDGKISISDFAIWKVSYLTIPSRKGDGWTKTPLPSTTGASLFKSAIDRSNTVSGSLVLLTDLNTLSVGDYVTVSILLDTGEFTTTGTTAVLRYDPGAFAVQDSDSEKPGIQVYPGTMYTYYDRNIVYPDQGLIWVGGYNSGGTFQGSGEFFTATLQAISAITVTEITVEYAPGWSVDSHIAEGLGGDNLLSHAEGITFTITGNPLRPMPTVTITPTSAIHEYQPTICIDASDPYSQVQWVQVWAWYDDDWHYIDTDQDNIDGWSVEWDTSVISDQIVYLWAYAALPGGEGGTGMTGGIYLDRTVPTYLWHTFDPLSPSFTDVVRVSVAADDNLAGVQQIEMYVNESTDGSFNEDWIYAGQVTGSVGEILWDTTVFTDGLHQIAFAIEDQVGNWNRWIDEDLPTIVYGVRCYPVYLPLVMRN